jgi:dual specificity MAP kinase phosphatase
LNAGIAFIEQVIAAGGKVYIHCAGGIGRAPTMAVAYFVRHGLSVDDAINLIKQTRPFINITPVQMEQLRRFERAQLEAQ